MIDLPPACLVRSLSDARRALAPGLPVTLLSARGAALFAGPLLWRTLADEARTKAVGPVHDILDCADAPGRALEALRLGQRLLVLDPGSVGHADVCARAAGLGARVLSQRPPALEIGERTDGERIADWLRRGGNDRGPD